MNELRVYGGGGADDAPGYYPRFRSDTNGILNYLERVAGPRIARRI